jgi:hypothetical protein
MYLLLVLIDVVNAQFITIPGKDRTESNRETYIDEFLTQKFKECRPFCINSKCGIKHTPKRKVCRISNLFNCVSGCNKVVNIAKNSWLTYSKIEGSVPSISIKNAW